MKNYKDRTITKLCIMLNALDDNGCLTDEEKAEYVRLVDEYYDNYEEEILSERDKVNEPATYHKNCYILKSREDGEVIVKTYDEEHENSMMVDVSKHICFSDCDDTYELVKVVYRGREVEYVGWRPLMEFKFKYVDTGDIAWKNSFMSWDHQNNTWTKDVVQWDYVCSRCNEHSEYATKFCPNCGARMEG